MVASAKSGTRNTTLIREAVSLAELVAGEVLDEHPVCRELAAAGRRAGLRSFEIRMTLASACTTHLLWPGVPVGPRAFLKRVKNPRIAGLSGVVSVRLAG